MTLPQKSIDGSSHVTDEKFNAASHLIASIFALMAAAWMILQASLSGTPWHIVSFSIYGASLFFLFLASTLHHSIMTSDRVITTLRNMDYIAIFLLIPGTFTPICLVTLRGPLGWTVLGVVWLTALVGIALKSTIRDLPKWLTNTLYLSMGWASLILAVPFNQALPGAAFWLLLTGGLCYTVGVVIFALERPNPIPGRFGFHEIWHVFVILGAFTHAWMMMNHVLPGQ